jgi:hypothetical protein
MARRLAAGGRWDLVFNIAEGLRGRSREAQVPALCELFDQPYTFSDPLTCAVTLDKPLAKRVVRDSGLPTAPFAVVESPEDAERVGLALPFGPPFRWPSSPQTELVQPLVFLLLILDVLPNHCLISPDRETK